MCTYDPTEGKILSLIKRQVIRPQIAFYMDFEYILKLKSLAECRVQYIILCNSILQESSTDENYTRDPVIYFAYF